MIAWRVVSVSGAPVFFGTKNEALQVARDNPATYKGEKARPQPVDVPNDKRSLVAFINGCVAAGVEAAPPQYGPRPVA